MQFVVRITLLVAFMSGYMGTECPVDPPCICVNQSKGDKKEFLIECQSRGLYNFPNFKPNYTENIDRVLFNRNYLRQIPVNAFGSARPAVIDVSNNEISFIDENAFEGIEDHVIELNIATNSLMMWPLTGISRLTALQKIDLTRNQGVGNLGKDSFKGLENLREIIIGECRRQLVIHDMAFVPLKKLEKLTITSCSIDKIPIAIKNLTSLQHLDLSANFIQAIAPDTFQGLENLKSLRLRLNLLENEKSLVNDSFKFLSNLEELYIDNCGVSTLRANIFRHLKKLKKLVLSYNNFKTRDPSPFIELDSLEELVLDDSPIEFSKELLYGLEDSLRLISLRGHELEKLPTVTLHPLRKLEFIDMSNNVLHDIPADFSDGITAWQYHLDSNAITAVNSTSFLDKSRRTQLFLKDNRITSLGFADNTDIFSLIDVTDNPIKCDCATYKLTKVETLLVIGVCRSMVANLTIGGVEFNSAMYVKCVNSSAPRILSKNKTIVMAESRDAAVPNPCINKTSSAFNTGSKTMNLVTYFSFFIIIPVYLNLVSSPLFGA